MIQILILKKLQSFTKRYIFFILFIVFCKFSAYSQGCIYDSLATSQLPYLEIDTFNSELGEIKNLPYPKVADQQDCNSCVAWALSYYALSMKRKQYDDPFSPYFICEETKRCGSRYDKAQGMQVPEGLAALKAYQNRMNDTPRFNRSSPNCDGSSVASSEKKKQDNILFQHKNEKGYSKDTAIAGLMVRVRQEISIQECPVILVIKCDKNLKMTGIKGGKMPPPTQNNPINHAVCVIGFNYNESQKTGHLTFVNSWGASWGNAGTAQIDYEDIYDIVLVAYSLSSHL